MTDEESIEKARWDNSELSSSVADLIKIIEKKNEQIEKMKNCYNCKNSCGNKCKLGSNDYFCNYDKWECR